jgi:hypothetical protein
MKRLSLIHYCVIITLSQTLFSCDSLNITSFTSSGAPGSIVVVDGDVSWARVIWDVGSPNQRDLQSGFLGANFFTVPYDADEGVHKFQIVRTNEQSQICNFTVTARRPSSYGVIQESNTDLDIVPRKRCDHVGNDSGAKHRCRRNNLYR